MSRARHLHLRLHALAGAAGALALALCAAVPALAVPPSPHLGEADRQVRLAKVVYPAVARSGAGAGAHDLGIVSPVSAWGGPVVLLVLGDHVDAQGLAWLRVRLDDRPNGSSAWIEARDTLSSLDPWFISISRVRRRLSVYREGRPRRTFAVVVGKPSTPTPAGLFAVAADIRQADPTGFLGSWVLPLTAHSDALRHFDGGDGQVALHGRGGASLLDPLGSARSHGCIRLTNEAIAWIATHVPVGTPVRVH